MTEIEKAAETVRSLMEAAAGADMTKVADAIGGLPPIDRDLVLFVAIAHLRQYADQADQASTTVVAATELLRAAAAA